MGVFSNATFGGEKNLDTISGYLENPNASEESKIWNYGRYAYITLKYNGVNNAGITACKTSISTLGDTHISSGSSYQSLIERSGERDIPASPILESVRIGNDGSTDVTDAALYDIDVSFKVFSAAQFAEIEKAWFVPGNEFTITFGYKGLGMGGSITGNVYNFSFTMDSVGVYSCNVQLTGRNRFAAVLSMKNEMAQAGTEITDEAGDSFKAVTILSELHNRFEAEFPQFEESSIIQLASTQDFVEDGKASLSPNGLYAVANIQTKGGFDFSLAGVQVDLDDKFVKYVKYEELINVINYANSDSNFTWGFGTEASTFVSQMASADPSAILLDGDMANYGGEDDDTFNDLRTGAGTTGLAKDILISLPLIGEIIKNLEQKEEEDKEEKGATSVNSFLSTLHRKIEDLTGGLYPLVIYNNGFESDATEFLIVHKYAEHTATAAAYTFNMHNIGSVLKSVNLSSNMDSDMAAAALVSNRGGDIPDGALDNLYQDCGGTKSTAPDSKVTLDDIANLKKVLGSGFSPERVAALKEAQTSYVKSNTTTTGTDTGYRYMIDLSVTHLGCWGTQIADTFSFDGLPPKFRKDHVYFAVGKVEHQFDGQGGWDTTVTGFCKIDDVATP